MHSAQRRHFKRRSLNTFTLALTVYCCVSGGPIGLEPLISASGAGLAIALILLTPIFWALPDALTTCELAPAIPVEGGYVVWVKRALGPMFGFFNGWWTWLYTMVDATIYPVLFVANLKPLLNFAIGPNLLDSSPVAQWLVGFAVIAAFTYLNVRGTRLVGLTSSAFAFLIIVPFLLLAVIGIARILIEGRPIQMQMLPPHTTLNGALAAGLGIVMWNYLGWDQLSTVAEEVDDPAKAYPRALLGGIPLVTLVYLLPVVAGLAFQPDIAKWVDGAWPGIAQAVGGQWLALLVNIAALISPIALFTASLLASSRVPFVLAEDGWLPRALMEVHPRFGTPWRAILVCGVIYSLLLQFSFVELVSINVLLYSAALFLEALSLVVLRYKEPDLPRPFKIPGGLPVLIFVVASPMVMIGTLVVLSIQEEGWSKQWLTFAALASAPLIYLVRRAISEGFSPKPN